MITTKKANFYIHKINRQEKSYEWKKKKKVYFHGINTGYLLPSCVVTFGQCSSLKPPKKLKWSLQLLYIDCKLKEQTWQVCVMRWNKVQVYKPDENKWAASWWNEQRQLRRNWLNQSFILFPPICCAVIGVRVTGRMTPSSLIRLNTYMPTHPSLLSEQTLSFVFRFLGKWLRIGLTNGKNTSPHLPMGTQSLQEQWEVTKVILQLQYYPDGPCATVICR